MVDFNNIPNSSPASGSIPAVKEEALFKTLTAQVVTTQVATTSLGNERRQEEVKRESNDARVNKEQAQKTQQQALQSPEAVFRNRHQDRQHDSEAQSQPASQKPQSRQRNVADSPASAQGAPSAAVALRNPIGRLTANQRLTTPSTVAPQNQKGVLVPSQFSGAVGMPLKATGLGPLVSWQPKDSRSYLLPRSAIQTMSGAARASGAQPAKTRLASILGNAPARSTGSSSSASSRNQAPVLSLSSAIPRSYLEAAAQHQDNKVQSVVIKTSVVPAVTIQNPLRQSVLRSSTSLTSGQSAPSGKSSSAGSASASSSAGKETSVLSASSRHEPVTGVNGRASERSQGKEAGSSNRSSEAAPLPKSAPVLENPAARPILIPQATTTIVAAQYSNTVFASRTNPSGQVSSKENDARTPSSGSSGPSSTVASENQGAAFIPVTGVGARNGGGQSGGQGGGQNRQRQQAAA